MKKENFIKKSNISKEDFLGKKKINVKPILLKNIGKVEIYELNEYNILEFCNFVTKFLEGNKESLERGEMYYSMEDRIKILNMFTNINLQNFTKNDIIEILTNSNKDVEEAEKELLQEIIPNLINKSSEDGLEQVLNMSKDEQINMVKQVKENTNIDVDEEEILKGLYDYKKKQELLKQKQEIEKQLAELGE